MAKRSSGPKASPATTLESALTSAVSRVSATAPRAEGSIVVRSTDSDDEFSIDRMGPRGKVTRGAQESQPVVTVRGPSKVLQAVLSGEMEASRAFASGQIRVRGDLTYLEAVLKDLDLLDCQ
ncbi:MAG TPA: SCP2 sterol-binding domain-containing protein [Thermomicrobiales bacterium]|nr:SCP2 sterol-binding domain-containing protein [Thermomicrobiales bacterium]